MASTAAFDGARALATVAAEQSNLFSYSSPTSPLMGSGVAADRQRKLSWSLQRFSSSSALRSGAPLAFSTTTALYKYGFVKRWQNLNFRLGRDIRKPQEARRKVLILGSGWGALNFIQNIDVSKYDVTVVSPRNYFTFSPLLPSACAGTLTPRACLEPIRDQLLRGGVKVMEFYEGWGTGVSLSDKSLTCKTRTGEAFELPFDYLVVAVGAEPNTFGIPGVAEYGLFLKEVEDARAIHRKVIDNFERAALPGMTDDQKRRLLHFVVVGGGPTGVETAAEFADFVKEDIKRHFPDLVKFVRVSLIEMLPKVLPMFSEEVSQFTLKNMGDMKIDALMKSRVTKVTEDAISIADSENNISEISYGLLLWASGVGQVPFAKALMADLPEQKGNRVVRVDSALRIIGGAPSLYAMGDCSYLTPSPVAADVDELYEIASKTATGAGTDWLAANASTLVKKFPQFSPEIFDATKQPKKNNLSRDEFAELLKSVDAAYKPPAPTAQNATQEALYLAAVFNTLVGDKEKAMAPAFVHRWKGSLAYVGDGQAVADLPWPAKTLLGGVHTRMLWKLVYWTQQMSNTNRCIVLLDWMRSTLKGRDVGRDHTASALPVAPTK